jgi:hypothetical protein
MKQKTKEGNPAIIQFISLSNFSGCVAERKNPNKTRCDPKFRRWNRVSRETKAAKVCWSEH